MTWQPRVLGCVLGLLVMQWTSLVHVRAQAIRHDTGQDVAPVFEGWEQNPDGSYNFVFGYLNRNYEEKVDLPIGQNNFFDQGSQDRGQPTHFYTRRQHFIFRVVVPKDWDKTRKLVWTMTSRGHVNQAKAWLQPEWELNPGVISENNGGGVLDPANKPPSIAAPALAAITLPDALTLTASANDDGVPKPRRRRPAADPAAAAAALAAAAANPDAPIRRTEGLRIRWIQYRGPGTVTFDPDNSPGEYGKPLEHTTKVSFSAPGTYVVRVIASDGQIEATHDTTVTVTAGRTDR